MARPAHALRNVDTPLGAMNAQAHVTAFTASDFGRSFTSNGALLSTTSVGPLGATLGASSGLSPSQMLGIFPNSAHVDASVRNLGSMAARPAA